MASTRMDQLPCSFSPHNEKLSSCSTCPGGLKTLISCPKLGGRQEWGQNSISPALSLFGIDIRLCHMTHETSSFTPAEGVSVEQASSYHKSNKERPINRIFSIFEAFFLHRSVPLLAETVVHNYLNKIHFSNTTAFYPSVLSDHKLKLDENGSLSEPLIMPILHSPDMQCYENTCGISTSECQHSLQTAPVPACDANNFCFENEDYLLQFKQDNFVVNNSTEHDAAETVTGSKLEEEEEESIHVEKTQCVPPLCQLPIEACDDLNNVLSLKPIERQHMVQRCVNRPPLTEFSDNISSKYDIHRIDDVHGFCDDIHNIHDSACDSDSDDDDVTFEEDYVNTFFSVNSVSEAPLHNSSESFNGVPLKKLVSEESGYCESGGDSPPSPCDLWQKNCVVLRNDDYDDVVEWDEDENSGEIGTYRLNPLVCDSEVIVEPLYAGHLEIVLYIVQWNLSIKTLETVLYIEVILNSEVIIQWNLSVKDTLGPWKLSFI